MSSENLKMASVACPMCDGGDCETVARGRDFEYDTSPDEFRFVKCRACGALYLNPRPDVSELGRIYPENYAPYQFQRRNLALRIRDRMEGKRVRDFRRLLPAEADLLDAGGGGPGFLNNLRRFGGPGWRLMGNDISEAALAAIEREGFTAVPGRFEDIAMPGGSLDAIFLKQVIEHLDAPGKVLEKASRLLRPGGLLVIETPNHDAWDARLFGRRHWGGYHFPRHWTIFDPKTLTAAGAKLEFEVLRISFMLSPSFWIQSVHHALKDRGWPAFAYGFFTHLNPPALAAAVSVDILQKLLTGKTSNMQMIFRKRDASPSE